MLPMFMPPAMTSCMRNCCCDAKVSVTFCRLASIDPEAGLAAELSIWNLAFDDPRQLYDMSYAMIVCTSIRGRTGTAGCLNDAW